MTTRSRQPVGASERGFLFESPNSLSHHADEHFHSTARRREVPATAVLQRAPGGQVAKTYGASSPGKRRPFSPPNNGNPITPGREDNKSARMGTPANDSPEKSGKQSESSRLLLSLRDNIMMEESGGAHEVGEGMLELEHIIGYTGHFTQTVLAHPQDADVILKCAGALLVIGTVSDPHQQQLLRGHDMEICALAVSSSGALLATGQCGSTRRKGFPAPVLLWEYHTRRILFELDGLTKGVCHLSFGPDQRFLLGSGSDCLVYIWDTSTGELVVGKQYTEPVTLGEWGAVTTSGRRPVYQIYLFVGKDTLALELAFDPARRQWQLSGGPMATPSSGLRRRYHCSAVLGPGAFLLCGTDVGDMIVYGIDAKVYRASIPVCSGGLLSICTDTETGDVYCGAGDGAIRKISGSDMIWRQLMETSLDGGVISLSLRADRSELIAGTQEGSIYRVSLSDLSALKISSSHKNPVLAVACGSRCDAFATCSRDGTVRVWDLCNFEVVMEASQRSREGAPVSALCMCWLREEAVVTGWSDCFVRCYDAASSNLRWEIPNAHRSAVTCCASRSDDVVTFLVTGAEDGSVSVWDLRTRELMLRFAEHQKIVTQVLVDVASPSLVHSVAADCTVFTYDLRREKRTIVHMTRGGAFQGMTQRLDSENELITCDINGRLLTWDCDYRDPVQALHDPSQQRLSCISVSPSGRYIVIGGDDETLKVLDLTNKCETVACGRAHAGAVTSVQWTKDERQLVSAAEDCTLAIWNFFGMPTC